MQAYAEGGMLPDDAPATDPAPLGRPADFYDFAPVGFVLMDREGTIRSANLAAASLLLGTARTRLAGQRLACFVAPSDRDVFERHRRDVLAEGGRRAALFTLHGADGSTRVVRLQSAPRPGTESDARTDPAFWWTALIDVTAQIEAEESLRRLNAELEERVARRTGQLARSERRLREQTAIAEMHRDVAFMANEARDVEQAIRFCLRRVAQHNGWCFGHVYLPSDEDPEVLRASDSWYADSPSRFERFRAATLATPLRRGEGLPGRVFAHGVAAATSDVAGELAARRAVVAGELGLRTGAAFPILVGDKVAGVLEFFSDRDLCVDRRLVESMAGIGAQLGRVLERSRAHHALQESELRLRQIADHIREFVGLVEVGAQRFVYCNPACERIWGRPVERLYRDPRAWLAPVHAVDRARVAAAAERMLAGEALDEQFRIVRRNGTIRWIRARADPVRDREGHVHRMAMIADDITARRNLQARLVEIASAEQERIGRDLHDTVGQELAALALRAERLCSGLDGEDSGIAGGLRDLAAGIRGALAGVRAAARGLTYEAEDGETLRLALEGLAASMREQRGAACRVEGEPVRVRGRDAATQLFRIASEAVSNAVRHARPAEVLVSLFEESDRTVLRVADDGTGIPDRPRVGSGLWIMRQRAEAINGALDIRRGEGGGTVVECRVPLRTEAEA